MIEREVGLLIWVYLIPTRGQLLDATYLELELRAAGLGHHGLVQARDPRSHRRIVPQHEDRAHGGPGTGAAVTEVSQGVDPCSRSQPPRKGRVCRRYD